MTEIDPRDMEHGEADAANEAADLPYKDDTSDGTTAKSAQEVAEETAGQVRSSDDVAREQGGIERPEEGHDVRDYRLQPDPEPTDDDVPDGTQIPTRDDMPAEEGDAGIADAPGQNPAE